MLELILSPPPRLCFSVPRWVREVSERVLIA